MDAMEPLLCGLVNKTYVRQGLEGLASRHKLFKTLLSSREVPSIGWDDLSIELILAELAAMDSNNFPSNIGAGEREGRVYSSIVSRRHFRLSHGIGRSGDVSEVQPKSAGSSIVVKVTTFLFQNAIKICGLTEVKHSLLLPLATGMSLMMCMSTLKTKNPTKGRYVIWPRIDQKSCFKSILSANLIPLIVENILTGDQLITDVEQIERLLEQYGDEVLAVLSTTSCFAPRSPDNIDGISQLCKKHNIPHIINNAYGLQCRSISQMINRACRVGRVDYIVSSLDKNFMIPVGGACVMSPSEDCITALSKSYPGRASITPILDLFITLLSMGKSQLVELLDRRDALFSRLKDGLGAITALYGERVLLSPNNPISIGITLSFAAEASTDECTRFGSMLFQRCVSGARVVPTGSTTTIGGYEFIGWGAHSSVYSVSYLTAACAIGMTEGEIEIFLEKLGKVFKSEKQRVESLSTVRTQGSSKDFNIL